MGFYPVAKPSEIDFTTDASVSYIKLELVRASHSFRAAGSGITNQSVVQYGAHVREFAVQYPSTAFSDFEEAVA